MIFIAADNEPTMVLLLTEQDCNDMRGGRTKFVDRTATRGLMFDRVVISLHKSQAEAQRLLRAAGHGKLLEGAPSPVPQPEDAICAGCRGIMKAYMILDGKCIGCWRDGALVQERKSDRLLREQEGSP